MPGGGSRSRQVLSLSCAASLGVLVGLIGWRSIELDPNFFRPTADISWGQPIGADRRAGAGSEIPATGPRSAGPPPRDRREPEPSPLPARLLIPHIGVDTSVESVALDADGNVDVPSDPNNVGWYRLGPAPGLQGNAIIDGHVDWYTGPSIFWRLTDIVPGDQIFIVKRDGARIEFRVDSVGSVGHLDHPEELFADAGSPRLSLITCTGAWDRYRQIYLQRLVVQASLVAHA